MNANINKYSGKKPDRILNLKSLFTYQLGSTGGVNVWAGQHFYTSTPFLRLAWAQIQDLGLL